MPNYGDPPAKFDLSRPALQSHLRSLEPTRIDRLPTFSLKCTRVTMGISLVSEKNVTTSIFLRKLMTNKSVHSRGAPIGAGGHDPTFRGKGGRGGQS